MIYPFYRYGILPDSDRMAYLACELKKTGKFGETNNESYCWRDKIVNSGLELASKVLATPAKSEVLLVGHSQGGLVCRMAALALAGTHRGTYGEFTQQILNWRRNKETKINLGKLAVVMIATPNSGVMTYGQMSVMAATFEWATIKAAELLFSAHSLNELTTPVLFQEFENWDVKARYLSISGVYVNRYNRGWPRNLSELPAVRRISVRFDVPNDLVVEDSSTDLRQSLIRPEVDLADSYRHARAYPTSISLTHGSVCKSDEVVNVIVKNLDWLFS